MVPSVPQPGDVIAGKYEISRLLGKGGMGVVVEAQHKKLGTRVAIKFLMPDALTSHDSVARFDREARASALLRSPYVVRVLDIDATPDGLPFIVMEYLDGHDLGSEIRRRGQIPVVDAVDWVLQACIGLAEAHARGIVHRDIKPANLYLCKEASGPIVKVMDFGVSKLLAGHGEIDLTTTDTAVGTPNYMAPEQLLSSRAIDHRADVWALGVVLYRMLCGAFPFSGATPTALAIAIATEPPVPILSVAPSLPPDVAAAVMRALEKDVARRHADVVAFGRALEPFGSKRVAFAAAVAGMPPPHAQSAPDLAAAVTVSNERTHPMEAPVVVDDMNAGTERAWAKRAAGAPVTPRRSTWPLMLAMISGTIALLGALAISLAFSMRKKPPLTASSAAEPAASVTSSVAESAEAAFAPPPPTPEPGLAESVAPTPPPTAALSAAPPHPARPNPRATATARAASSSKAAPSSTAPPEDPLHL